MKPKGPFFSRQSNEYIRVNPSAFNSYALMKPLYYFIGAGLSILLSIYIFIFGTAPNHELIAIFIGLWAPTIICLGVFNTLLGILDEMCCAHKRIEERQTCGHER